MELTTNTATTSVDAITTTSTDVTATTSTYEQFERIDGEKRERILQAALEEFASNDYAQASTNAIVARAGISKGLLFHYFGDKAGLYSYLLNHISEKYTAEVMRHVDFAPTDPIDIFDTLKRTVQTKFETTRELLLETNFFTRAMEDKLPAPLQEQIQAWVSYAYDLLATITNSLDESLLHPGITKEQAGRLINWMMEGLTNELVSDLDSTRGIENYQHMTDVAEEYFDLLRLLFYQDANATPDAQDAQATLAMQDTQRGETR
jgi:AcrR family transcriptional regulator